MKAQVTTTDVLVIKADEQQLTALTALLSKPAYDITPASTDEEAIEKFLNQNVDVVILGNELTEAEEQKLRKLFSFQQDDMLYFKSTGNVTLVAEIKEAIAQRDKARKPSVFYKDNTLAYAKINIKYS